jgi:hypothetical protein
MGVGLIVSLSKTLLPLGEPLKNLNQSFGEVLASLLAMERMWIVGKTFRFLGPSFLPSPKDGVLSTTPLLVANLINVETNSWRFGLLEELFDQESIIAISSRGGHGLGGLGLGEIYHPNQLS